MKVAERYTHPEQTSPMRPDVGTQAQFRKKRLPKTYRYDSSLSPSMEWDGQNASRELGDLVLGSVQGRSSPQDITLFKSLGLAVEDAAAATLVLQNAHAGKS